MGSLALDTLLADRGKLLVALVGVIFSIVLVNVQGGLYFGLIGRASLLVDHSRADIWAGHKHMKNVDFPRDIPRRFLPRIRAVPGVRRVEPYLIGWSEMTLPSGGWENVVVVGTQPGGTMGGAWNLTQGGPESLRQTDAVLFDDCEADKLESPRPGEIRELGNRRIRFVGATHGITGFLVAPYIFTTYERAASFLQKRIESCSYFLIELEPGADAQSVCEAIRRRVPQIDAFPRDEFARISVNFWMTRTGLGISFGAATLLGLLVGMVMVAQTLYALVLDRLGEFATLKAIGAREGQIYAMLLLQAGALAMLGSAIGLGLVALLRAIASTPRAPILIPWWLSLASCALVLAICLIASLLPYHRIRNVDPMLVLQS